jgi:hypothetical protein
MIGLAVENQMPKGCIWKVGCEVRRWKVGCQMSDGERFGFAGWLGPLVG